MNEEWTPELVESVDANWQQRFEKALTSQGYAVWDWDMLTHEITWQGDCDTFGYSREELSSHAMDGMVIARYGSRNSTDALATCRTVWPDVDHAS